MFSFVEAEIKNKDGSAKESKSYALILIRKPNYVHLKWKFRGKIIVGAPWAIPSTYSVDSAESESPLN